MSARFYPVALDLAGKRCLVVGGGAVAQRKVQALLDCGAAVTVIAPAVTPGIKRRAVQGGVHWEERPYRPGDLDGFFLVISATDEPGVNARVASEAREKGLLINAVDHPELCNFVVPATLHRGDLTIAISSGGKSPALVARLRRELETLVGPEYGVLADLLGALRPRVKDSIPDAAGRERFWQSVLDSDILELIRRGQAVTARRQIEEMLVHWPKDR